MIKKFISFCGTVILFAIPAAANEAAMAQAEARLNSVPEIPNASPLSGQELVDRVSGGPYALTIYSAGIVGSSNWDLDGGRAHGTFRVVETGDSGDWAVPASVSDGKLCTTQGENSVCQTIYAWENGFMEVNDAGEVHAVTVPVE